MKDIFYPDRQKFLITVSIICGLIGSLALRKIPAQIDIFDLREVPWFVMFFLGRVPIELFDFMTSDAFVPRGEWFFVFPTLPQVAFAAFFDVAAVYLVSCLICHSWRH